jgi:hypothetical protein
MAHNPVRYTSLEELGIDPETLSFQAMPVLETGSSAGEVPAPRPHLDGIIAAAKVNLAAKLGVSPDSIEIIVRA